jgi:acyl-CoA synthetase (NDP forming)
MLASASIAGRCGWSEDQPAGPRHHCQVNGGAQQDMGTGVLPVTGPAGPDPAPPDLSRLFEARSIVLVGASADPGKTAGKPLPLLASYGYAGQIMVVNPAHGQIAGHRSYPQVADLPDAPELALILTRSAAVPAAVDDVLERGARDVIVVSGGFADTGDSARQQRLADRVQAAGGRLLGPNCLGLANLRTGLTATFAGSLRREHVPAGDVSLVTQSGSVGNAIVMRLAARGIGLAKWAAVGNEAGVTALDVIGYLIADPQTRVIACFVESARDGRRWAQLAARAQAAGKPFIAVKGGRSQAGALAVQSHSGKAAGSYQAWRQIVERAGATVAESLAELADKTYALGPPPAPASGHSGPAGSGTGGPGAGGVAVGGPAAGRPAAMRLAAVGTGGFGVIVSDAAAGYGVPLAELAPGTVAELRALLPATATVHNPVDPTPVPDEVFFHTPKVLLADPGVDAVLLTVTSLSRSYPDFPGRLRPVAELARRLGKRLAVSYFAPDDRLPGLVEADLYRDSGVLFFADPVQAVAALAVQQTPGLPTPGLPTPGPSAAVPSAAVPQPAGERAPGRSGAGDRAGRVLGWPAAQALLAGWGVPVVPTVVLTDRDEAARYCQEAGPVVLKIDDPAMPHKTEHAAVQLDLRTPAAAAAAFDDLAARRGAGQIIAQPYLSGGTELVVGCWTDPELGPVVSLGLGGTLTELAPAPVIAAAPLTVPEAARLLAQGITGRLLAGYRGSAALPVAAVAEVAAAVSAGFAAQPGLRELEINPLVVRGDGAHVVDILAVTSTGQEQSA